MFKKTIDLKITIVIFASLFYLNALAQGWNIPAEKKARNSNFKFTSTTAKQGEDLFSKNCISCHGNPGKGNNIKSLNPIPPDLAGTITQKRTDGEIFYIVTTGKMIMPSFANVFSEEQRWNIISYLRTFNKNYVQVLSKSDVSKSKLVKIITLFDSKNNNIQIEVTANEPSGRILLKNAEVSLFVNRYFGRMQIEKTMKTDNEGVTIFNFPKNLPGDKKGNVNLIVKVNDEVYGEIESQSKFKIGIPTNKPSLTENRAIWNVMAKAPIWLLITYFCCVLIVLSCFLYIFYNLYKIHKIGKSKIIES